MNLFHEYLVKPHLYGKKNAPLKFIYSEKATKFCKIFPLLLTSVHTVKSKGKISQNFVAFSEYTVKLGNKELFGHPKIVP